MVFIGLDGNYAKRPDSDTFVIRRCGFGVSNGKGQGSGCLFNGQFFVDVVAQLHRFYIYQNAGDVRCVATFTVFINSGCCDFYALLDNNL